MEWIILDHQNVNCVVFFIELKGEEMSSWDSGLVDRQVGSGSALVSPLAAKVFLVNSQAFTNISGFHPMIIL